MARLVAAGADVSAHCRFDSHTETPLHWAASSNDVAVLDALLDAGADIAAPGAVLGGGTALADAWGFGNWDAARRLVERGSPVTMTEAAALGLMDRLHAALAAGPSAEHVTHALWAACAGGQLDAVRVLVAAGGDADWVGWDGHDATAEGRGRGNVRRRRVPRRRRYRLSRSRRRGQRGDELGLAALVHQPDVDREEVVVDRADVARDQRGRRGRVEPTGPPPAGSGDELGAGPPGRRRTTRWRPRCARSPRWRRCT